MQRTQSYFTNVNENLWNELKTFGLNPKHWQISSQNKDRFQLHHVSDPDFRLTGRAILKKMKWDYLYFS